MFLQSTRNGEFKERGKKNYDTYILIDICEDPQFEILSILRHAESKKKCVT